MKSLIIIFFFLPFLVVSQLSDTTCIKYRWISLKPTAENEDIFLLDSNVNNDIDLVHTIKRLVEDRKVFIYDQNTGPFGMEGWYYIDYDKEREKMLDDSLSHNKYFELKIRAINPLINVYGQDSLDSNGHYAYPPDRIYVFPARESDEIRIKEERVFNDSLDSYEFIPVGLSFYFEKSENFRGHEKFWVDLKELFENLENPEKYPWYSAIRNKEYQGFQYMQVSCYDKKIKH